MPCISFDKGGAVGMDRMQGRKTTNNNMEELKKLKEEIAENVLRLSELNTDKLNEFYEKVKEFARKDKATFTQVRNIYSSVRKKKAPKELVSLRPLLAYVGARNDISSLTDFLDSIIKKVKEEKDLRDFKEFMKMFVCYKKVYKR